MAAGDNAAGDGAEGAARGGSARESAERDSREARIDPRYDPAFQRGFRGHVHRSVQVRPGRGEGASRPEPVAPAAAPPIQRPAPQPPPMNQPAPDAPEPKTDAGVDSNDGHTHGDLMPPERLNPYVVALWVVGIALSVGGVTTQWWAQMSQVSGAFSVQNGVPVRVLLIGLANTVSGPMITVGMATIVGLIFMLALRRGNTSSSPTGLP